MRNRVPNEFFEDTPCSVGTVIFPTGEEFAAYAVDFDQSRPTYTRLLLEEQPFSLHVREKNGRFCYVVHGSKTVFIVGAEGAFQVPFFSSSLTVTQDDHERFQQHLEKQGFWILIVRAIKNSILVIDKRGMVFCDFEQERNNLQFKTTSNET